MNVFFLILFHMVLAQCGGEVPYCVPHLRFAGGKLRPHPSAFLAKTLPVLPPAEAHPVVQQLVELATYSSPPGAAAAVLPVRWHTRMPSSVAIIGTLIDNFQIMTFTRELAGKFFDDPRIWTFCTGGVSGCLFKKDKGLWRTCNLEQPEQESPPGQSHVRQRTHTTHPGLVSALLQDSLWKALAGSGRDAGLPLRRCVRRC